MKHTKVKTLSLEMLELNGILKKYVSPSFSSIIQSNELDRTKRNGMLNKTTTTFNKTFASTSSFSITHDQSIYSSVNSSKKILEKNKKTHKEIMKELRKMERTTCDSNIFKVFKEKQKYTNCKKKIRELTRTLVFNDTEKRNSIFLPSIEESKSKKKESSKAGNEVTANTIDGLQKCALNYGGAPMPVRWRECEVKGWRPEAREGATLTTIWVPKEKGPGYEERVYLYGGLSRDILCTIGYLTNNATKTGYQWVLKSAGDPSRRRFGHAAMEWEKKLVIVGGARMYSKETKRRECLNDVLIYNPADQEWTDIHPEGVHFDPRRNHCACMVGKHLLVYGGINGQEMYESDLLCLNLTKPMEKLDGHTNPYRWIQIKPHGISPGNLAFHTCQLILHPDRYKSPGQITLTSLPDIRGFRGKIEIEGVYIFGGRDENGPTNRLFILKVGQKHCEWVEPSISGTGPMPRYGHSMNHYSQKDIIIIFGGRNDENYEKNGDQYLDDVWVLSLGRLKWTKWEKEGRGSAPAPRYLHCAALMGSSIMIFGGISAQNYCPSAVNCLDMEYAQQYVVCNKNKVIQENSNESDSDSGSGSGSSNTKRKNKKHGESKEEVKARLSLTILPKITFPEAPKIQIEDSPKHAESKLSLDMADSPIQKSDREISARSIDRSQTVEPKPSSPLIIGNMPQVLKKHTFQPGQMDSNRLPSAISMELSIAEERNDDSHRNSINKKSKFASP